MAMRATPSPRRTYLDAEERRAQILRVAAELFSERHYDVVSTAEVAQAAGVARGLVHHYFGTKRDLYLEVVRKMVAVRDDMFPAWDGDVARRLEVLSRGVDRFLRTVQDNRGTWLASIGAQGFGSDPEIEAMLEESRSRVTDQLIRLAWGPPQRAPAELRTLIRGYDAFAKAIAGDWLLHGQPSRDTVHEMLVQGLLALVDDVLPKLSDNNEEPDP